MARRLIHVQDFDWRIADGSPDVRSSSGQKYTFSRARVVLPATHFEVKFACNNVNPLVLLMVQVARTSAGAGELEYTHRAVCVLGRYLAIVWFAGEFDVLIQPVFACGDAEAYEHFLTRHNLCSF